MTKVIAEINEIEELARAIKLKMKLKRIQVEKQ